MPASWYKKRTYPHFDLPLPYAAAAAVATDPKRVERHPFFPFLGFEIKQRRFRKEGKGFSISEKVRPIRMSCHLDGYIFAYYAHNVAKQYEQFLNRQTFGQSILAYRRGLGSNITFASAAFDEVDQRKLCTAIAIDIEQFFDSIDHQVLKRNWIELLGKSRLPEDHFRVFKAVTRYSWVDRDACYAALGIEKKTQIPRPICSAKEFREIVRSQGLVNINNAGYGIPQGSPMSAVLSNVYMLQFDKQLEQAATSINGYYRRYCDDVLWIVEPKFEDFVQDETSAALNKLGSHIKINSNKTLISQFSDDGKLISEGKLFQYLGFTYDGSQRLIRSQTLSRFWRRATFGIRAARNRADKAGQAGGHGKPYRRKIYRRFTHLGKRNFYAYVRRAQDTMDSEAIRRQFRRHWSRIQNEFKR